ncbi:MAG: chromate transporter [Synergistaceae bacterium]|nr:chromate transporter [Synergistaceae bacterium]
MPLSSIFLLFLRIGAFTFGGGLVMLGFIEKELRSTARLSSEEIADMMVLATAFPGPVAANMAFLAGKRLAGIAGSFCALLGTVIPPFLTILLLSQAVIHFMNEPWLAAFFLGAACAVVVIIGRVVYSMTRVSCGGRWKDIAVFAAVGILLISTEVHPFFALAGGVTFRLLLGEEDAG